jgi:molecular chaperone DnaK
MISNEVDKIFYSIKRLIGRKYSDNEVKKMRGISPYKIVAASNGDVRVCIGSHIVSPEKIISDLLIRLKNNASKYLGHEVTEAVITVPAYFNDAQRSSTKQAAEIAGLKVLRLINEPTAASFAYYTETVLSGKIAVYDLGGGTFDMSIVDVEDSVLNVLSTHGDSFLGGDDIDYEIVKHFIGEFKQKEGVDLNNDYVAMCRLKTAAEKAKIQLSTDDSVEINVPYISQKNGPLHFVSRLRREQLEQYSEKMLSETIKHCEIALQGAGLKKKDITAVVLVGGQTRMPLCKRKVEEFFCQVPKSKINPEQAVSMGAAIQAGILTHCINDILLLDVTPLSLGIETMGGVYTRLIEKNTTIPLKKSQIYSTAEDNQSAVTVHVVQGEREMASENKSLERFELTGIQPVPRGVPQIEVTFEIDANGILNVSAKDKATGTEQLVEIKAASGLSEEEILAMVKDAEEHKEADKKFIELITARNQADAVNSSVIKCLKEHTDKITDEDKYAVESLITELKKLSKGDDKDAIEEKTKELANVISIVVESLFSRDRRNETTGLNADSTSIVSEGQVIKVHSGNMYRVKSSNNHVVTAHISGKMRMQGDRFKVDDEVMVELSPHDLSKGRVIGYIEK